MGTIIWSNTGGLVPFNTGMVTTFPSQTSLTNIVDASVACTHELNDILSAPSFAGQYDAYRINSVTLNVEYLNNMASTNGAGLMPTMYMYWDQDDAAVPSTLGSILGKMGVRRFQFGDKAKLNYTIKYKPTVATAGLQTPTPTSLTSITTNQVQKSPWLNCLFPTVKHYGIKIVICDIFAPGTASANAFRFNFKYNVSFRAPLNLT